MECVKGSDSAVHADRRDGGVFRAVFNLRGAVFFHAGRAGIYECLHGRRAGIRQIPGGRLREKDPVILDVCRTVCADPVLPAAVSAGEKDRAYLYRAAASGLPLSAAGVWAVEIRGGAVSVQRVVKIV